MKAIVTPLYLICLFVLSVFINSCSGYEFDNIDMTKTQTRAVPTPLFDWENLDWMPTPSMQSQIPSPWSGQGSLVGTYGIDIINDRKACDGWELLYNTFDSNVTAPLVNPYFVLYNKYRGIMRIYLYLTTSFVTTSSYIQDGITIVSNYKTSILNYLGHDIVDLDKEPHKQYMQMQPAPIDGSLPLAANRWYMMQYELAYNPNLANIPYNDIQFSWTLNYYNVQQISLGGKITGNLNGTIGSASESNFFKPLLGVGKIVGTGVLAGVGQNLITNNTINADTGENKLGLPNKVFKGIAQGVSTALSAASGNFPGAIMGLLSAVVGGSSSAPIPISLTLKADITLNGTGAEGGAFPSTPISFWVPGTNIMSEATGYIPFYNKSLGVFYLSRKPEIELDNFYFIRYDEEDDHWGRISYDEYYCIFPDKVDYTNLLVINPEVLKVADVEVIEQELIYSGEFNPREALCASETMGYCSGPHLDPLYVRFVIKVSPKNGVTPSFLIKTFEITPVFVNFHF